MIPEQLTDTIYSYENGELKELKAKDYPVDHKEAIIQKGEYCTLRLYYVVTLKKNKKREVKLWRFLNQETLEDKLIGKLIIADGIINS